MNHRKIIYGLIYVGVALAFPALPLQGLKFVGGVLRGAVEGTANGSAQLAKDQLHDWKNDIFHALNPFD
jgi:hypothetical protein